MVFDPKGKYLRSWGKGMFESPHGLRIDRQNHVWVTDTVNHLVEFTNEGQLQRTWGVRGQTGTDEKTFNRPPTSHSRLMAIVIFPTDTGTPRVVKFSTDGD